MKKILFLVILLFSLSACGPSYEMHVDESLGISVEYPQGWYRLEEKGSTSFYAEDFRDENTVEFLQIGKERNPSGFDTIEEYYEWFVSHTAGIEIVSADVISVNDYPGYELSYLDNGKQAKGKGRLVLVEDSVFAVIYLNSLEDYNEKFADSLVSSFQILA